MSGARARALTRATGQGQEFSHVLAGVMLDGDAALLAAALDPVFLAGAGWDPVQRVLSLPAGHPMLGRVICKASGCDAPARGQSGVCQGCFTRLSGLGMTAEQIGWAGQLPPAPARITQCAVPRCPRPPASAQAVLCRAHQRQRERRHSLSLEQFLADPGVQPLRPVPQCTVSACSRLSRASGYCSAHYWRWREAVKADPGLDDRQWQQAQQPAAVSGGGVVRLHELPPLVAVQVLAGIWQRTREGTKTGESDLRMACRALARQQVTSIGECDTSGVRGISVRALLRALARHVRLALADPEAERDADIWDLEVFGHRGRIDFTGITQPWLRESAKRWAAQDLPRHRGRGAVRAVINSVTRLSESLRARPDHGSQPAALSRRDIENFLNRLGYLESAEKISRCRRNQACRGVRVLLASIRALGLTRPGGPAAGLPGDVTLTAADIPALPEPGEPGRDLPAEIMDVLCASLGTLQPDEIKTAVQIAIDTGRRPEEITSLPLDCLTRDRDGKPVLIYNNIKAHRDRRRLPVSDHTAAVITAQQARVTARFPATPPAELPLLPTGKSNPSGRRHISVSWLGDRHHDWAASLGPLRTRDGTLFDPARIILYAYRHTYAQRHADAGVPIDVLAKLLDHKKLDQTRGYYRVGEQRRREAVDKVTAMSFDRHGSRTWRDARALLDSEHARYAIGQVAVPYGTCTEPSNVAAGGNACPVRFRCAGCDHFRTDVSHLPDLTAYLDDLLRTRERLAAAIDGVDDWARADAMPADEEITRIRRLISRIHGDLAQLSAQDRAAISDAVTVIRKHRAVSLGMPAIRTRTTEQENPA